MQQTPSRRHTGKRPVYTAMQQVRLNLTVKQDTFLRSAARERGLGKAELLRRIVQDAMEAWIAHGLYVPPMAEVGKGKGA